MRKMRNFAFVCFALASSLTIIVFQNCAPVNTQLRPTNASNTSTPNAETHFKGDFADNNITPEIGGSNYAFVDLGRYASDPSPENWASDVKTPIVHYHLMTKEIQNHLDFLIDNQQKKISLMVWHVGPGNNCEFHMHTICPSNGQLPPQAKSNLKNLLADIVSRPFEEVHIRIAPQGNADIHTWTQWEALTFESNRQFAFDIINVAEDVFQFRPIPHYYDLGVELMGHPHIDRPWYAQYLSSMWQAYIEKYSLKSTIGFSFNHVNRDAFIKSLQIFDRSGVRPPRLGIDLYLDRRQNLVDLGNLLESSGWSRKYPVFIQETYLNDAQVANEIREAIKVHSLNIRTIMQWPLEQGRPGHATTTEYYFDNYR